MKSYLSLIPISARVRRKQNRLTLMCIILAVFLVTSIFSIADIWLDSEKNDLIRRHGNYHIILHDVYENNVETISERKDVSAVSWYDRINSDADKGYYLSGKNAVLYGVDKSYVYDIRNFVTVGTFPQNDNEVMLSAQAKELLGIDIGDSITLNTPQGEYDYTVSGFCEDDTTFNNLIDGICAYINLNELKAVCTANNEDFKPVYYIQFAENARVKKAITDIKTQYGLTSENMEENTVILGMSGSSSSKTMTSLYPMVILLFLFILIAGVLMISSCINSNITQRTKFFGMLRCIGASRQQIMNFVKIEALNWCKTAIPIGCGLGIAASMILCMALKNIIKGEFIGISFKFSVIGVICGAAVGIITVLLAAHSPAKRAAMVSPMSAVSGNDDTVKKNHHAVNTNFIKVETALGIHHSVSAKKNLVLMTLSFAFTIILLFCFFACFDFLRSLIPTLNSYTPDVAIVSYDNSNSVSKSLKDEVSSISGVKQVYGNMIAIDTPAAINGNEGSVDLLSYDNFMFDWSKGSVVEGDVSKITDNSNYALTVFNKDSLLRIGDKIKIGETELEIACVVSEGIWGDAPATVICSEETFTRITGESNYVLLNAILTKDAADETANEIRNLAGDNKFSDQRENNASGKRSYWVFRLGAYGFLAIIALITIFNIMNSISMSVTARMKQYGAMRAVGMSVHQLTKMITAEAVTYVGCGFVVGCVCGVFLHRLITIKLVTAYFGAAWSVPTGLIMITLLLVALSCAAAVYAPTKRIRNMVITETINEL